ncbi:NAD-dependent dehydratase [Candidatus Woesearchaeota archaeon]|nr:MAG: NAD-dependent dehydratase [Candidatus Woesearchaeota archaeon]
MKTVLVTGGAGFLGSHLCEALLKKGNKVICVDNLYTGSENNISKLFTDKNFSFINHDIIEKLDVECDEIYNLACPASPPHYQKNPVFTLKTSVLGIINLLELARKNNARLLHASTSEVYGDPLEHPQKESYWGNVNPIGIRSCYDEGKRVAETFCMDYKRKYDLDVKIIRIFNTYGPNMDKDDGRVVSNFINQALKGKDITIYGDGTQTRSFCYVSDLIEGIIKMMEFNESGPINLGNPNEFTMLELADKVIDLIDSKSKISFSNLPEDDPKLRKPDITLAKEKLDWEPKINLQEGLKKTIEYFKKGINQ